MKNVIDFEIQILIRKYVKIVNKILISISQHYFGQQLDNACYKTSN